MLIAFNFEITALFAFSDGDPFHRNTTSNKQKCPITIKEMIILVMKQLVKYMASKNTDFQKSDGVGKPLLEKYDKYQRAYVNRIKDFLPRISENPDYTVQSA
jgi:hypothetical protein